MNCPRDNKELSREMFCGVVIDSCTHCDGTWMDKGELASVIGLEGDLLGGERVKPEDLTDREPGQKLTCPRCGDYEMEACYFSPERRTVLDHCEKCGGIWLDSNELRDVLKTSFDAMEG